MTQNLSVIIVNWNTRDLLRRCLVSLQHPAAALDAQLIVVDNHSSDGSVEMLRSEFSGVDVIASEANLGFAAANNLALPHARGRYVLFLNPDTEVADGAISAMLDVLESDPRVGVVGTTLLNSDGTLQPSCHAYYSFLGSLKHNRLTDRLTDRWRISEVQRSSQPADAQWMIGACLVVRASVLGEVGIFDPDFFVYGEEVDLQYRIRKAGWRVVYVPSNGVTHHGGQSARQTPLAASFHDYRGRWLFVRKHYSGLSVCAYLAKTVVSLVAWSLYWRSKAASQGGAEARQQCGHYRRLLLWHLGRLPIVPRAINLSEGFRP